MPLDVTWQDVAVRLILTVIASALIGFDRESRGHAAGLRTTILVGLAAAVAMVQANMLLAVVGKASDGFSVMDVMRLPLGILTGVGFIGGGTILKRGDLVTGITTAATLWMVTVIGLCFGGGQLGLGLAATVVSVLTLWPLAWLDIRIRRQHRAVLVISQPAGTAVPDLDKTLQPLGYHAQFRRRVLRPTAVGSTMWFELTWKCADTAGGRTIDLLAMLDAAYTVESFQIVSEPHPGG